ncbi:hypothetical protein D2E26_0756 [Bifidobacterium dolichotidis]|uniref:Schlafen group 3-like DNA/RNA helicase domain-containing protein n=1 Tax=Bifidobacterium dolichotidis TaxID=2306976 RepID=A0A430FTH5_9BIFI|nr:DUF2075 domain-containing protein [Bifidobacterium dolichotidis]RSX56193.1 hypothetical protein D2E26_0756 [Bifidobacterium dolichotidis]
MATGVDLKPIITETLYIDNEEELKAELRESAKNEFRKRNKLQFSAEEENSVSALENKFAQYVMDYPVVYIVHKDVDGENGKQYEVYVGETNDIINRTRQHILQDVKTMSSWSDFQKIWSKNGGHASQYVIADQLFNKSLTLDIENKLIQYLLSVKSVRHIYNGRTNPQGNYYTQDKFDKIFTEIWRNLNKRDSILFPAEKIILDSALFKASPFHQLSEEQCEAENQILQIVNEVRSNRDNNLSTLVLVSGAAGTGKTVLLSHLFYNLMQEIKDEKASSKSSDTGWMNGGSSLLPAYIAVKQDQQRVVYDQIATRLRLQKKNGTVVLKPTTFINQAQKLLGIKPGKAGEKGQPSPRPVSDVVLVDEAHLLLTQGNQGYRGDNMLLDLLRYAKVVIAVYDPRQVLESSQRWIDKKSFGILTGENQENSPRYGQREVVELGGETINFMRIKLNQQFRMAASDDILHWFEAFTEQGLIKPIPVDPGEPNTHISNNSKNMWKREPYQIHICSSPWEVMKHIREKNEDGLSDNGLSRVVATYDWKYVGVKNSKEKPVTPDGKWDVELFRHADNQWYMVPAEGFNGQRGYNSKCEDCKYFCFPWNYELEDTPEEKEYKRLQGEQAWAEKPHTINEIGSTYSIQGFDLNYVGVILGPSIGYDNKRKRIVIHPEFSKKKNAIQKKESRYDFSTENLLNELNVLMTRGVHGIYLFAVDQDLQRALEEAAQNGTSDTLF